MTCVNARHELENGLVAGIQLGVYKVEGLLATKPATLLVNHSFEGVSYVPDAEPHADLYVSLALVLILTTINRHIDVHQTY